MNRFIVKQAPYRLLGIAFALFTAAPAWSAAGERGDPPDKAPPDRKAAAPKKSKKTEKKGAPEAAAEKVRWGQRRGETAAQYDKRYAAVLRKTEQDKHGDFSGGHFENAKGEKTRLWTYNGNPFIVRTDISKEFTADAAMYMEMLHREYSSAYSKLLGGVKADLRGEKVEVIIFADRDVYMKNGGTAGSGGFFHPAVHLLNDRGPYWPARHYRLQQFTDGVKDFAKWPKATLKHEAAHMELQLRLGYTLFANVVGFPVDCPRWWNEGHASVFEYWDFDRTVEENLADIPNRGRYAPVIRRLHGTGRWKDFHYVWTINPKTWHEDMTDKEGQGFLNYAQAWSLAAYMMHSGNKGRADFRKIFDLSKRVGADRQTTYKGDRMLAWEEKFPAKDREQLESNWNDWVGEFVSREKRVPDEDYYLQQNSYKPDVVDQLERYSKEEVDSLMKDLKKEEKRRKKEIAVEK
jgi:hypothetical protein